jgi:hypothetical protein
MSVQLHLNVAELKSSAKFSPCRQYRYSLWRQWSKGFKICTFIGLNPSTADETINDPTIRRCIKFAKDWGFDQLCMLNLFAYRATDPAVMKAYPSPIGEENDKTIAKIVRDSHQVIAAWGTHGAHLGRADQVRRLIQSIEVPLYCLNENEDGSPAHPLYQKANVIPFRHHA